MKTLSWLASLKAQGFDRSYYAGAKQWRVRCSCCEALVINGMATHERGCPNVVREEEEGVES
jgi:hypothetical protein